MDIVIISFLCLSILLYFLLGGADFGAGIIELFTSAKNRGKTRSTMYHAIGPVWEANHMWLIIAIVIPFCVLSEDLQYHVCLSSYSISHYVGRDHRQGHSICFSPL
jgi:hypothetical protein